MKKVDVSLNNEFKGGIRIHIEPSIKLVILNVNLKYYYKVSRIKYINYNVDIISIRAYIKFYSKCPTPFRTIKIFI